MRILQISQNHYVAGGMDRVMFDQARILSERGHDVVPFTAADPADAYSPYAKHFPIAARTDATPLKELPNTLWRTAAAAALEALLVQEHFDIIHLHSWYKRLSPAILPVLRQAGLPIVQTLHEYRSVCSRSTMFRDDAICRDCAGGRRWPALRHRCNGTFAKTLASIMEMELADRAGYRDIVHRFLPVSAFQRDLLAEMGLADERMRILPNPVALPATAQGSPARRTGALFVGRIEAYKGVALFVELARMRPDIRFAMAGDGSEYVAIEAAKPENLDLLGRLGSSALASAMRNSTCVIVPSLWPEAFGLTAVEAMATQTPVIASRTGGLIEIVRDGIDGYLAASGDVTAFAKALDALVANPGRAATMGANGGKRAAEEFSEDRFYDRLMRIYRDVMSEKRSVP